MWEHEIQIRFFQLYGKVMGKCFEGFLTSTHGEHDRAERFEKFVWTCVYEAMQGWPFLTFPPYIFQSSKK